MLSLSGSQWQLAPWAGQTWTQAPAFSSAPLLSPLEPPPPGGGSLTVSSCLPRSSSPFAFWLCVPPCRIKMHSPYLHSLWPRSGHGMEVDVEWAVSTPFGEVDSASFPFLFLLAGAGAAILDHKIETKCWGCQNQTSPLDQAQLIGFLSDFPV